MPLYSQSYLYTTSISYTLSYTIGIDRTSTVGAIHKYRIFI